MRVTTHSMKKMVQESRRLAGVTTSHDGSSSDEYGSEGEGSKIAIDPDNKSETEELENQQVTHPRDPETFVPGETFRPNSPELMPQPQTTVFSVPAVEDTPMSSSPAMIGQQGAALQEQLMDSETNECEPEDNSTGRQTSGRVRKRTQVDGKCECDIEITPDEKEEGTTVMMYKVRGCETGCVRFVKCFRMF